MEKKIIVHVDADLEDIVPIFLENRRKDVETLRQLLARQDWEAIRALGHTIKGIGGGYGFDEISSMGADLEKAAQQQDAEGVQSLIHRLETYLSRVEVVFVEE
jgi:HPt (histidine-containing phosphotransfer) domain-containing protein